MVPVGVAVIAGHAMLLAYVASHLVMSAAIASGVLIFIAVKHVGITAILFRSVQSTRTMRRGRMQAQARPC
jgi:hypothetical protein